MEIVRRDMSESVAVHDDHYSASHSAAHATMALKSQEHSGKQGAWFDV